MAQVQIKGKVKGKDNQYLQGASVVLLDKNQVALKTGTTVQSNGEYAVTANTDTADYVQVTYTGYKPEIRKIPANTTQVDLGEFVLESTGTLETVAVVAKVKAPIKTSVVQSPQNIPISISPIEKATVPFRPYAPVALPAPSPAGLENFTLKTAKKLGDLENRIDDIFSKYVEAPLKALNEVDICNIINYYLSQVKVDLIKNPDIKQKLDQVRSSAYNLNEAISKYTTFTTIANTPRTENTTVQAGSNTNQQAEKQKLVNLLDNLRELGLGIFTEIPTELLSVVPGLGKARSTVEDITAIFTGYKSVSDIPNADVQKIVNKVHDLQAILGAIASINSAQSIVNLLGVQSQIRKLQQIIDPARLLPAVKKILQVVRNINQAVLQIFKILSFAKVVVKILTVLIRVFKIIVQLFKTLPLPNMFSVHGITATLEEAKETVKASNNRTLNFLEQISRLLALVYEFAAFILEKVQIVTRELQILVVNMEACAEIKNLPILQDVYTNINTLVSSQIRLVEFTDNYARTVQDSQSSLKIPGYTFTVIEEELVDEGRRFKRRRAVAYNDNGLLVAEGDLTFATNNAILIQELKLRLQQQGVLQNSDNVLTLDEQSLLDSTSSILGIDEIPIETTSTTSDMVEVQAEINDFISGLKNGVKLKRKAKQKVDDRVVKFKQDVKDQGVNATTSGVTNVLPQLGNEAPSPSKNLLTSSQRKVLKAAITAAKFSFNPAIRVAAEKAKKKLEEDDKARAQLAGG
jgi:hypothetical protein